MPVNLFWDFDGTICDTYPAMVGALHDTATGLGGELDRDDLNRIVRAMLSDGIAVVAAAAGVAEQTVIDEYTCRYRAVPLAEQPPIPGVLGVMRLAVATGGTNGIVTHRGLASVKAFLAEFGLTELISVLVTADDGLPRKPEPHMFELALQRLGEVASKTIVIGDRGLDIEGGAAVGLSGWAYGFEHPLAEFSFDHYAQAERQLIDQR